MVWVRYNPNSYNDSRGKKIELPQAKKEEVLIKWVKYLKENEPSHPCSVLYLFYDSYLETDTQLLEIKPYDTEIFTCSICGEKYNIESVFLRHVERGHHELKI